MLAQDALANQLSGGGLVKEANAVLLNDVRRYRAADD